SRKSTLSTATNASNRLAIPAATRMTLLSMAGTASLPAARSTIRQQLRADRNLGIVGVLGNQKVELVLAARLRLHPLRPDDAARRNVRNRTAGEIDEADRGDRLERAQRFGDGGLVIRLAAVLQRRESCVEQRHRCADLLVPLLVRRHLIAVGKLLRAEAGQRRAVGEVAMPVA